MNIKTTLSALTLGLALLPLSASATLLVGLHKFNTATGTQNITSALADPNYALAGFSGSVVTTVASEGVGGSNDNLYGNSALAVLPGMPMVSETQDGHGKAQENKNLVFNVTNSSGSSIALASLLFDAAYRDVASTILAVTYQIGAGPIETLTSDVGSMIQHTAWTAAADFTDFGLSLLGVTLANAETIKFTFSIDPGIGASSSETIRLDNIALTGLSAIPETASAMALALLIGGGLMTRNRRSAAAPTLA